MCSLRAVLQELIQQALTKDEFTDLVFSHFPSVYAQFTEGQSRFFRIRLLLEYIETRGKLELDRLLEIIKSKNSRVFAEFQEKIGQIEFIPPQEAPARELKPPNNLPFPRLFYGVPPLPEHFVDRPEVTQSLKARLLQKAEREGVMVVSAIHAMGGIGKSTLAIALAYDPDIQKHYKDGILWVTLGQQPNILSLLNAWIQALGDYNFKTLSPEAASDYLRKLLCDQEILLVVDDAWNTMDAQYFKVGGASSQVLVTTRDSLIADGLGASLYPLGVMTPDQAKELLVKKLRRKLEAGEVEPAAALAKAVGYLPLALELAVAQVGDGITWTLLLQDLEQEVARLKTFERPGATREAIDEASLKRLSLRASLNLSIQRLSADSRLNFTWLGVLPEDVVINPAMAATLWEMEERDAADELLYLRSKALLSPNAPLPDGRLTYLLHDLFHDLARNLLTDTVRQKQPSNLTLPGLGLTLPAAHAILLERYRQKARDELWHTLPDDGYIHEHLFWHLEKAEWPEEIHNVLREEADNNCHGWHRVRERLGQTAGFFRDVELAWKDITQKNKASVEAEPFLPRIGDEIRYTLYLASVSSLAANLPPELLLAFIKHDIWTFEQALQQVRQFPGPAQKIYSFCALAANTGATQAREMLLEANNILPALMPWPDEHARLQTKILLLLVQKNFLQEALEVIAQIKSKYEQSSVIEALIPYIKERDALKKLFAIAQSYDKDIERDAPYRKLEILLSLLPSASFIQAGIGDQVLTTARALSGGFYGGNAFSKVLEYLSPDLRLEVLEEAIAAAFTIPNGDDLVSALVRISQYVTENHFNFALEILEKLFFPNDRAKVAVALSKNFPAAEANHILAKVLKYARHRQWSSNLYQERQAEALAIMAREFPEQSDTLWQESLTSIGKINWDYGRCGVLSKIYPEVPEHFFEQVWKLTEQITEEEYRFEAIQNLLQLGRFSSVKHLAILAVPKFKKTIQTKLLKCIALQFEGTTREKFLKRALVKACQIQYPDNRYQQELEILSQFPNTEAWIANSYEQIWQTVIEQPEDFKETILIQFARIAPERLHQRILEYCFKRASLQLRFSLLETLAPRLSLPLLRLIESSSTKIGDQPIIDQTLRSFQELSDSTLPQGTDNEKKIDILASKSKSTLLKLLLQEVLNSNLSDYRRIKNIAIGTLAICLARAGEFQKSVEAIACIQPEASILFTIHDRCFQETLKKIAPLLPQSSIVQLAEIIKQNITPPYWQLLRLHPLLPFLPPEQREIMLEKGKRLLRKKEWDYLKIQCLVMMTENLKDEEKKVMIEQAVKLFFDQGHFHSEDTWIAIASLLTQPQLMQAYKWIDSYKSEELKAEALLSLAPFLPEVLENALESVSILDKPQRAKIIARHLNRFEDDRTKAHLFKKAKTAAYSLYLSFRTEALLNIIVELEESERVQLIRDATLSTLEIDSANQRTELIIGLLPHFWLIPLANTYEIWQEVLKTCIYRRSETLLNLQALKFLIYYLGGQEAIQENIATINEVSRWWP